MRRTRAVNNRPCLGQLTTKETARLNSILGSTKGNFDKRCNQLRQWYTKKRRHPSRKSDDNTEVSLAVWVNHARRRRTRAITNHPSGRQFTASETAQLNSILASASKMRPTKDHFQRCNELRQWCMNHSGERPRRRSDDQTETSLAMWLDKALSRRARAHNNRPSGRQLTATETEHLNSILA